MSKILITEDTTEIQIIIRNTFSIDHELTFSNTIQESKKLLQEKKFDLIILDIGLPDGDGLRFCSEIKTIKKNNNTPVFILSGKTSIEEKILGFQLGIEDFITKPFNPIELKIRVEARLRKIAEKTPHQDEISIGNLKINLSSQRVGIFLLNQFRPVELSSKEFGILTFLARHPDQVKSREEIISAIWGYGFSISDRTIDSHISRIRKKIKNSNVIIEAITHSGYRLYLT